MDFPGVIRAERRVLDRFAAANERPIDGHAPGLTGKALNAYVAAGPHSDHESTTLEEAREKLRRGMWLMVREGTTEKNLANSSRSSLTARRRAASLSPTIAPPATSHPMATSTLPSARRSISPRPHPRRPSSSR